MKTLGQQQKAISQSIRDLEHDINRTPTPDRFELMERKEALLDAHETIKRLSDLVEVLAPSL